MAIGTAASATPIGLFCLIATASQALDITYENRVLTIHASHEEQPEPVLELQLVNEQGPHPFALDLPANGTRFELPQWLPQGDQWRVLARRTTEVDLSDDFLIEGDTHVEEHVMAFALPKSDTTYLPASTYDVHFEHFSVIPPRSTSLSLAAIRPPTASPDDENGILKFGPLTRFFLDTFETGSGTILIPEAIEGASWYVEYTTMLETGVEVTGFGPRVFVEEKGLEYEVLVSQAGSTLGIAYGPLTETALDTASDGTGNVLAMDLVENGVAREVVGSHLAPSGGFVSHEVGADMLGGDGYRVVLVNTTSHETVGRSIPFRIQEALSAVATTTATNTTSPVFNITFPSLGASLKRGQVVTITTSPSLSTNRTLFSFSLHRMTDDFETDVFVSPIAHTSDTEVLWKVPRRVDEGPRYLIRAITKNQDEKGAGGAVVVDSEEFGVFGEEQEMDTDVDGNAASDREVIITLPSGGSQVVRGSSYDITWIDRNPSSQPPERVDISAAADDGDSDNDSEGVDLVLYYQDEPFITLARNVRTRNFQWHIPDDFAPIGGGWVVGIGEAYTGEFEIVGI